MNEPYRIEVLHIVNPHVIFVESQTQKGIPVIQQIGIYGALPVNKTIDIDGQVVAERCENWPVAANAILREFLGDHKNCVYFVPIQVDERSTIFNDNIHLFGDIIVKAGKRLSVSDHLVDHAVAIRDEAAFHQKLALGSLKTKLNVVRTEEVINAIKKYYQKQKKVEHDWNKTINKQTSLHQESKIIADLTTANLKLFDRNSHHTKSIMDIIESKERDFNLCKDADLVSAGCGVKRNRSNKADSTTQLRQPHDRDASEQIRPHKVLNDVKIYLEANCVKKSCDSDKLHSEDHANHSTPVKDNDENVDHQQKSYNQDKIQMSYKYHQQERSKQKYSSQDKTQTSSIKYNKQIEEHDKSSHHSEDEEGLCHEKQSNQEFDYLRQRTNSGHGKTDRNHLRNHQVNNHRRNVSEHFGRTHKQKMTTSQCEDKKVQGSTKRNTAPLKPRERRYIFCPDMEMSQDNLKSLVPVTVIEDLAIDYSKITTEKKESVDNYLYANVNLADNNACENIEISPQISQPVTQSTTKISTTANVESKLCSSILRRKLQVLKDAQRRQETSFSSNSDTSVKDTSSSTEHSKIEQEPLEIEQESPKIEQEPLKIEQGPPKIEQEPPKIEQESPKIELEPPKSEQEPPKIEQKPPKIEPLQPKLLENVNKVKRNVNPFKNLDGSQSVFVDKLVSPILMVHTKNNNLILPQCELRDIPFKPDTHCMLRNMRVQKPKRLQTVTWSYILRGHSVFMIGPSGHGKTFGYVPAICDLVTDCKPNIESVGPICVIVCATALSVSEIENYCKRFLDLKEKIITFFSGIDPKKVTTALLNGCHVLICTAPAMVTLLEVDFGVDLRRLMTLVFDDCERLSQVYASELNKILHNVNRMMKNRVDKSLKVQYVVASRQWCDFMAPLAKKAPDTVIAIGASQECVLYSKTKTSVNFVKSQGSKVNSVIEFLEEIDHTKRTVVVCRADNEVDLLENTLKKLRYTVFACNSTMTLHDLYKLNEAWSDYEEPVLGPILICCDGNLTHMNITNANYLVHFSLPPLFSMFCKRFSVLNDNYASTFSQENENVKIKILLDETNVEHLPKILHFVKRCTKETFPMLDNVLQEVLKDKDFKKAENLNPICNNLLMLGECIDVWNCPDRHTAFKEFDESEDWIPKHGVITFKILHYDSAVTYSARVLSRITESGPIKYPNNYHTLSLKMGMYYSKEVNRKLHGIPKVGDICAVALKQNFFERCKVMRIMPSDRKNSYHVLINLIDEEQLTITSDVHLYYLPNDLKAVNTHVVKIRLANIQPKDKDVTFSLAAKDHLKKMADSDSDNLLYMRGQVVMTLGSCIFVDTAEACIDLSSVGETVVKRDFGKELLSQHAEYNPHHIENLKMISGLVSTVDKTKRAVSPKVRKCPKWAHLDQDDFTIVILAAAVDAGTIFIRHAKFQKVLNLLLKDIEEHINKAPELLREEIYVGNIVLAEFPDDKTYERARIEEVVDDKKVNCFFVDNGDWRQVSVQQLRPITDNIIHRIPFQAIECRLIGVKPPGNADDWPEFSTSWLLDNCFEVNDGSTKYLYAKYFTKEKASVTGGHKYGVVLFDTNSDQDVVVNKMMIELNLAKEIESECKYIVEPLNIKPVKVTSGSSDEQDASEVENSITDEATPMIKDLVPIPSHKKFENNEIAGVPIEFLLGKPIRSVPLVNDSDSDISDKWDVNVDKDLIGMFGQPSKSNITEYKSDKDVAKDEKHTSHKKIIKSDTSGRCQVRNVVVDSLNYNKESYSSNTSGVLQMEENEEISELMTKTPVVETQTDSDDIDIGKERIEALNILKSKLFKKDVKENSLNNLDSVQCETNVENQNIKAKTAKNEALDSDDLSSALTEQQLPEDLIKNNSYSIESPRKPKLIWRQNKNTVTIKIVLIGVDDYALEIKERYIRFQTWHNDTTYDFDFELYGVIIPEKSVHSNKGQYIQVKLVKILHRNWLNLTRDFSVKKWIVYDVEAIDFSTDEDDDDNDEARKVIKHNHETVDSASEDDDFIDDMDFRYKKH